MVMNSYILALFHMFTDSWVQRLNLVKNTNTVDRKHKLGWMFCLSQSCK